MEYFKKKYKVEKRLLDLSNLEKGFYYSIVFLDEKLKMLGEILTVLSYFELDETIF